MMNLRAHGTTITCVPCEGGCIIGNDSRISNDDIVDNKTVQDILTDEEVKLFQLGCEPNMYCTLMGDYSEWHKMYKYLLGKGLKSVQEAVMAALDYLDTYQIAKRENFKIVGTIIVGYDQAKGIEYHSLTALRQGVDVSNKELILAIGSGSDKAKKVLMERNENDYLTMTREDAVTMTLKALKEACFDDIYTGVNLKVTFVHSTGCISDTYQLLEVYSALYEPTDEEKATLFLVHSKSIGVIFGDDNIYSLADDLWSDAKVKQLTKYNIIGNKACFFVIRIVLSNEKDATKVVAHLTNKNKQPLFPQALAHISHCLIDCIRGRSLDHIYVGRSSCELLEGLNMLEDADTLKYGS